MQSSLQALPVWAQFTLLIVPMVSATCAAIGLLLTYIQSRRTNAQSRAALVAACLKGFAEDEEIQRAYYRVEYFQFVYDDAFHGTDQEREVDKLLRHFANIALSWQAGLLTIADVRPIQYYVLRVMSDNGINQYLEVVDEESKKLGVGEHPYAVLEELADAFRERDQ